MTGFGAGGARDGGDLVQVQIATVNHKSCQVRVRGDLRDLAVEERVRSAVRKRCRRGHVDVRVLCGNEGALPVDRARLADVWRSLHELADELGAPAPRLEEVARLPLAGDGAGPDPALVDAALAEALDACDAARDREGDALAAELTALLDEFDALRPRLRDAAAQRLPPWRERLVARLREVLPEFGRDGDDPAVLRECSLQAERIDVAEELARLDHHCASLRALIARGGDEPLGRELEFLLQEVGRELNTTGAKANDAALTELVIAGKGVLEQMREQAANVC